MQAHSQACLYNLTNMELDSGSSRGCALYITLICCILKIIDPGHNHCTPQTHDATVLCDVVLEGKIGYGTVSETLSCNTPLVFVHFNEEPFFRKMLEFYKGVVEMNRRDFLSGQWVPYLEHALVIRPNFSGPVNGSEVAAGLLEDAAHGKAYSIEPESGARRLKDAIVFEFQMQRHPGQEIEIPDWYMPTAISQGLSSVPHSHGSKGPYCRMQLLMHCVEKYPCLGTVEKSLEPRRAHCEPVIAQQHHNEEEEEVGINCNDIEPQRSCELGAAFCTYIITLPNFHHFGS
ncbi:unnamed protein product [Sphagnum balticum]